jgi:hypothetical protein
MHHIATIFVAGCMVLSAASIGAVRFLGFQRVEPKELAERTLRFLKVRLIICELRCPTLSRP